MRDGYLRIVEDAPPSERPVVERVKEPEDEVDRPVLPYSWIFRAPVVPLLPSYRRVEVEPATPPRVVDKDLVKPPCEFPPEE